MKPQDSSSIFYSVPEYLLSGKIQGAYLFSEKGYLLDSAPVVKQDNRILLEYFPLQGHIVGLKLKPEKTVCPTCSYLSTHRQEKPEQ